MKAVEVIVDLPITQTNQPYTYLLSDSIDDSNIVGKRVLVDFNHRHLLGFVVGLLDVTEDLEKYKYVQSVLDEQPVLNKEHLELEKWLSRFSFAYRISVISTMLPNKFKVSYIKNYHVIDEIPEDIYQNVFLSLDYLPINSKHLSTEDHQIISKLIQQGKVEVDTELKKRDKVKTRLGVSLKVGLDDAEEFLVKANENQKKVIKFFLENPEQERFIKDLSEHLGVSEAVIKNLITKGLLNKLDLQVFADPLSNINDADTNVVLNQEQQQAIRTINEGPDNSTFLLEGVTGSGKTEVYLNAIEHVLNQGKTAIYLVPEITLTSQIVRRVKARFGDLVGILHSELNDQERLDQWNAAKNGEIKVIVGTRSAIFAPLENLGLIVIDEEHDSSFKQEDNPRYHARDVVLWRAKYNNAKVVLGSATPSLESRARGLRGVYQMIYLKNRANKKATLPEVTIVDLKETYKEKGETNFSGVLLEKIRNNFGRGKQSILLLNRRGYSSFMMCRNCGYVPHDKNCDVALTVHLEINKLKCHYCGHEEDIPHACPVCQSRDIRYYGTGTQQVQSELESLIPEIKTLRMDVDTTSKKGSSDKIIQAFANKEADVLIGTQMVAKGLDFPDVTLVGVINSDTGLNLPDFRSNEKTFDLLTQVAGRAGRAEEKGEVVFQTFNPDHYVIQLAQQQDYEDFFKREMYFRHLADYPPYFYSVRVGINGQEDLKTSQAIGQVAEELKEQLGDDVIIVGPSVRPIARVRNRYQYQMLIKFKKDDNLYQALEELQDNFVKKYGRDFQLAVDREPMNFI